MEDDNSKNRQDSGPGDLSVDAIKGRKRKKTIQSIGASRTPKNEERKSFRRSWRSSGPVARWTLIFVAITAVAGVIYSGAYIWTSISQHSQSAQQFVSEHRPRLEFSRQPELMGTFSCEVTDKSISYHSGEMNIFVRNTKHGDAVGAFPALANFKLVPDQKTGNHWFDDLPSITEKDCEAKLEPTAKAFAVNGGREVKIGMRQAAGVTPLMKTKGVSINFGGGPQPDPQAAEGNTEKVSIPKDATFTLFAPLCVYYFGEDGTRYGTCQTYRFLVNGRAGAPNHYSFSCTETPVSGNFEATMFNYCEN